MKKIYLLIMAVIFAACSTESVENDISNSLDSNLEARAIKSQVTQDPMSFYAGPNKKGSFTVWNDCHNLYIQIAPTGDAPEEVEIYLFETLPVLNNGGNFQDLYDYDLSDAENLLWTVPLSTLNTDADWYIFIKAWGHFSSDTEYGKSAYISYQFDLDECCDESFSYSSEGDGTYTFTYIPEEDMENAVLTFTFPQAVTMEGLEDWTHNGNGNAQTFKRTLNLTACTAYVYTVTLDAECNPSGKAILWTDFKVGEDSKKELFELENIVKYCN